MRFIFLFLLISLFGYGQKLSNPAIIPQPDSINVKNKSLNLKTLQGVITIGSHISFEAAYFENQLMENYQIKYEYAGDELIERAIYLFLKDDEDSSKYRLSIEKDNITIEATGSLGIFYGIQTLLQIINEYGTNNIPCLEIIDSPNFLWRGMHLDCSRHFFSVNEIKKYLDYMALYKMNVFHWHLTDDQGWRIEIKKYPELTKIGAWRNGTMVGKYSDHKFDNIKYGGFYTQEQIKDIVKYASQRHITIVPEIEMPGHSLAALASYPLLACNDSIFEVGKQWGVFDDVFCAGNDSVFQFLENVLDEVMTLFPGEYIHIGGDECPKTRWKTCDKCQKRMQDENLADEHELQSYFVQRVERYINTKGKKLIGWDEILEGGLAPNAAVMSWRGESGGITAANAKHNVVMTPGKPCYFDHYQVKNRDTEPLAIGGLNTLKDVYSFNPLPKELSPEFSPYILGAQGNVWTEYIPTFTQVEYMALPRMAALAEVLWSGPAKYSYEDFIQRLTVNVKILDSKNVNYCKHFLD